MQTFLGVSEANKKLHPILQRWHGSGAGRGLRTVLQEICVTDWGERYKTSAAMRNLERISKPRAIARCMFKASSFTSADHRGPNATIATLSCYDRISGWQPKFGCTMEAHRIRVRPQFEDCHIVGGVGGR